METISIVTSIIGLILIVLGLLVFLFQLIGVIKYKYILNRMHAAGMGDTLGISLCLLGVIFLSGINFTSAKILLIVAFLWFASPTASHLISRLEASTDEELGRHVDVQVNKEEDIQ